MRPPGLGAALCLLPLLPAGCASPAKPAPPPAAPSLPEDPAAARRDERQKIMQEYWYEHAVAAEPGERAGGGPPPLLYPAGNYDGINFAPRQAAGPGLAEPIR